MVGISKNDVGARVAHGVRREPLHRPLCTDRHESRCLYAAVRREDFASPRGAISFEQSEGKGFGHYKLYIRAARVLALLPPTPFILAEAGIQSTRNLLRWVPAFAGASANL